MGRSTVAVLTFPLFSGKSCGVTCRAGPWEPGSLPPCCCSCISVPLFYWSGWRGNQNGTFVQGPEGWEAGRSPTAPFPASGVPSCPERCWPGTWGDASKRNLSSFACVVVLRVLFLILLNFLKWIAELFSFVEMCLIVDLCWGTEARVPCSTIWVTIIVCCCK